MTFHLKSMASFGRLNLFSSVDTVVGDVRNNVRTNENILKLSLINSIHLLRYYLS